MIAFLVQWVLLLFLAVLVAGVLRQPRFMQERWQLAAPPVTVYELHQQIAEIVLSDATDRQVHLSRHLARGNGGIIARMAAWAASAVGPTRWVGNKRSNEIPLFVR